MSVNDGFSDEEWGAWGKPAEPVVTESNKLNNDIASDSEVKFNAESSTSKFSNYNNEQNSKGGFREKNGFNGNRDNNSRFGQRKDNYKSENKFKSNENYKSNGYGNDRNKNNDYQSDYKNTDNKRNNFEDKSSYRNNRNDNRDGNRESDNYNNRKGDNRRDYSDDDRKNNSVERQSNRNGKRKDSLDRRNNRDDDRRDRYKREDSRDNKCNRRRDDSYENDRNSYRRNHKNDNHNRDDSREKHRSRRDSSIENRNPRRREDFDRDSSRDSRNRNYKRREEFKRDDSREKSRNYKEGFKRDDSREKSRNHKDGFKRDDSMDRDRNHRNEFKHGDSRENRKNYNKRDEFDRDESNESRNGTNRGFNHKSNGREEKDRNGDRNRNSNWDRSPEDFKRNKHQNHRGIDDKEFEQMADEFQRNVKLSENEKFSRTFVRGHKTSEKDDQVDDVAPVTKRATFIPDDDQEDYELHVNSGINFDNYEKIPVEVTGDDAPPAINSFTGLDLPEFLMANVNNLKYSKLTPVQKYAIPIIDAKRDLMACAQTGSGKTAAFLIPIIKSLNEMNVESPASAVAFPKALIMAPTRELCRQIFTAARQLCRGSHVKCAYIYGGIEMNKSRRNIQASGCDILVATPGRLIHFLELVWLSLRHLKFFVLDEADRMLESEGFYESVNKIYVDANFSGDDRTIQISMFSATFPNEIQSLARNLLKNYLFLAVGVVGSASSDVKQEIIQTDQREKVHTAIEYIKTIPEEKTLIFVESKRMADFFGIKLGFLGFKATTIHGDREQEQREVALNDFKSGRVNFMVATNVAARGLDIPKVDNVINIDMPGDIDTYVHRIGRTGRCGNVGRAISLFDETKDIALAQPLASKLEEANQECPDWLRALCSGAGVGKSSNYSRDTRKDVKTSKFLDNPTEDGFMKGTNIDYEDAKPSSEWLED